MNEELLKVIDNSISSILWIRTDDFNNTSKYFQEFNYLTSGILERKMENLEGLYQTKNFNKELHIALLKKNPEKSILEEASSALSLFVKDTPLKILIVHDNIEDNLVQKFSKKYKKHNFIEYSPKSEKKSE